VVTLAVGAVVAYPPHGVGRVAALEKKVVLGVEQEVVVIELADSLSVTLPLERAQELLRPVVTEAGLRRVRETLRADAELSEEIWSKRLTRGQELLRSGGPEELAAIVRDGFRRELSKAAGGSSKLSVSERALFVRARELLSGEIGVARGLDQAEADAWIDEQLALPKPS
jgi:CarD family transcriptional regulator, regulator of rRNA transcription